MKVIKVTEDNIKRLIKYALEFGTEHDSSYLPGRDFDLSAEHPSYLLMEKDQVVGAVSLMRTKRFLSVNKGRFSIFHAKKTDLVSYEKLREAIRPHMSDLQSVFMFIPENKDTTAVLLTELGFEIERYSFILERSEPALPEPVFPEGIEVHALHPADLEDIAQFVDCLNKEFKDLAGHTTNSAEDILTWFDDRSYLDGGICLLKKGQDPIGTISLMQDLDDVNAGEILAFGIVDEYRGQNLGRNLLRYGTNFLMRKKLSPVILSVNGENHAAIKLYEAEGYVLTDSVVCYSLEI
jgi:mycothiol synthase